MFRHALVQSVWRNLGQLVESVAPAPISSVPQPSVASLADDAADLEEQEQLRGLADLRAAVHLVASGVATSVTLGGFPNGQHLLRVGRELAIEGVVVEPLIRFGGGIDIRVRHAAPTEA
jgi:hypothetical protein